MKSSNHFIKIYRHHGKTYQEMIGFEDTEQNLRPALESITQFKNKQILDIGTGTGRIPSLFPELAIIGLDLHRNMLTENQRMNRTQKSRLVQADMRYLPFPQNTFHLITAGWAIGHFMGWYPESWQNQVSLVLNNALRSLRPGGWMIIVETMTTGSHTPAPPSPGLKTYYTWLEMEWGFSSQVIQTDFQFDSLEQAVHYAEFFFGQDLANLVRKNNWVRLPEWTGIWSKQIN